MIPKSSFFKNQQLSKINNFLILIPISINSLILKYKDIQIELASKLQQSSKHKTTAASRLSR